MHHIIFKENTSYETALLIKYTALKKHELESHYTNQINIKKDSIIAFSLKYNKFNKTTAKIIKEYLDTLLKSLDSLGITTLYVCDAAYFKALTKSRKADPHYGYILDCKIKGYEHMKVILGANYQRLFYNPAIQIKIDLSLKTLVEHKQGIHITLGSSIIHSEAYPDTINEIKKALNQLHQHDALVVDLETFSLIFNEAGIGTIAFAWDKHNGIAFCCDYVPLHGATFAPYGRKVHQALIKGFLLDFFLSYKGKLIYHNANFDIKVLIYELFMRKNLLNQQGLINGLQCLTKNIDDTKIITYLATNTTAGNVSGLKENAHEFAGNYAEEDIKYIHKIPKEKLLRYNLVDCLSTWYVKEKNEPIMIADKQQQIYDDILLPSVKVILQMELSGMPMSMDKINKAETELNTVTNTHLSTLSNSKIIQDFTKTLRKEEWAKKNLLLKVKVKPIEDFTHINYNPGSSKQTAKLLCDTMGLPALDLTDAGQPGTGVKTLEKLKHHTINKNYLEVLDALIGLSEATIILNTFINAFKHKTIRKTDGSHYLHGNFNIGGTLSGRLSSCLPEGTMVQSREGLVDIVNITVGTKVLTHKGNWKPVVGMVDSGTAKVYKVTLCNGKSITCTGNHRLLTTQGFLSLDSLYGKGNYGTTRKSSIYSRSVKFIRKRFY